MSTRITWFFLLTASVAAFNVRPSLVHHGRLSVPLRLSDEAAENVAENVAAIADSTEEEPVAAVVPVVETSDEVAESGEDSATIAEPVAADVPVVETKTERFTIYFGNLPYSANVKDLKAMIEETAEVRYLNLPKDKGSDRIRGFGFVDVASEADIPKVIDAFDGVELDGRPLRVSRSVEKDQIKSTKREVLTVEGCKKLYVGNLSFDTTRDDLFEYVKTFGEVTDVFLPEDNTGKPRGFAFISVKDEDVEAVIAGAHGTDFMGRPIAVNHPLPPGAKAPRKNEKPGRMKIYVGNLAFFTTSDTVSEVFSEFGEIHDVYIPKDIESDRSRGFGFVSMQDEDGQAAIDSLDGCELDGRIISVNAARPRGEKTPTEEDAEEEASEESN